MFIEKTPQIKNDIGKKSSKELDYRTEHGERYVQACPYIGMTNQPFGRYAKPCSKYGLYDPDPQVVADELLTRTIDKTVDGNLFIATWIQFMIHDWISHKTNPVEEIKLNDSMKIERTVFHEDTTYTINENNSWWDGSQIYKKQLKTNDGTGHLVLEHGYLPIVNNIESLGFTPLDIENAHFFVML